VLNPRDLDWSLCGVKELPSPYPSLNELRWPEDRVPTLAGEEEALLPGPWPAVDALEGGV